MRGVGFLAGFLEGEGSFQQTNQGSQVVSARSTDPEPLVALLALCGGSVHAVANYPGRLGTKSVCAWRASGARARGIMMTVYSLMSPRRQGQIRKALNGVNVCN